MDLELPGATVFLGDCIERMKQRPAGSVQMCVTSPPYYGLRDYGVDGQIGLEETPEQFIAKLVEVFREVRRLLADDGTCWVNIGDSYSRNPSKGGSGPGGKNGAYSDTYTKASKVRQGTNYLVNGRGRAETNTDNGIKHKDLIGIPWMLAFALRADGWYLRQEIIWHKPNPMPESVTDRCTKSHESLFLLSKSPTYFFDHEAIKEPAKEWTGRAATFDRDGNDVAGQVIPGQTHAQHRARRIDPLDLGNHVNPNVSARMGRYPGWRQDAPPVPTRNRRSVWTIATKPYKGAHFAVFPPALVEPCILAGTSARGHCPTCSARWERSVKREFVPQADVSAVKGVRGAGAQKPMDESNSWQGFARGTTRTETTGWAPSCNCYDDQYAIAYPPPRNDRKREQRAAWSGRWKRVRSMPGLQDWPIAADVVMDCFNGSGTTGEVSLQHGRKYEGFELSADYLELTRKRLAGVIEQLDAAEAARVAAAAPAPQMSLFA